MKLKITLIVLLISNFILAQNYHDTQGKLEISGSGQASYILPIALPPSINNIGPTINIVYSSGQNDGIAGQGWNISGVSNISRISTRIDVDGFKDGVDFDDNDKLSFDGQRLIVKSGSTYWADGSIYETEIQSNTKIQLMGSGINTYFIVTSPDGSRSWYGKYGAMNATDLSSYYIVRYEDANGNFMLYNYSKPLNKSLCIDTIYFSANINTNITALNYIKFNYTSAERTEKAYFKGLLIEKSELLNNIKVFTNSSLFKEYRLTHTADPQLGYQRVTKIQEYNGAGEQANPVLFEYNTTENIVTETRSNYNSNFNINHGIKTTGDFDGDGKMDIIDSNNLYTKLFSNATPAIILPFTGTSRQKFAATTLTNNKLNQSQSIVFADETLNNIAFKIHRLNANTVTLDYTKNITFDNANNFVNGCPNDSLQPPNVIPPTVKGSNEYLEGDFNGDGISEVLIFSHDEKDFYGHEAPPTPERPVDPNPCQWFHVLEPTYNEVRLIDLNPNVSDLINTAGNCSVPNRNLYLYGDKKYVIDFNSDGKADILVQRGSEYKIISFKQLSAAPWIELEVIGEGVFDNFAAYKPFLIGDYNADGKPDIMIPKADGECVSRPGSTFTLGGITTTIPAIICPNSGIWDIYYANPNPSGGNFFTKQSIVTVEYHKKLGDDFENFFALDINKDGKTDLVNVRVGIYNSGAFWDPTDSNSRWTIFSYINNIGNNQPGASSFYINYNSPDDHSSDDNSFPLPLIADFKYKGLSNEMLIIRYHGENSYSRSITYIDFVKDIGQENLLKKVIQSDGAIVDEVVYTPMESSTNNGFGFSCNFYHSNNSVIYPLLEIKQIPSVKLVSQLKNTSLGVTKFQDFKYCGYIVKLDGIGSIGFKKSARSSWYNLPSDKKSWSVTEIDPLLRGATSISYTLKPSTTNFSFTNNSSINMMSKNENTFTVSATGVIPYTLLLQNQKSTDFLTGIVKQTIYNNYDSYSLPTNVTNKNFLNTTLQSTTTTETIYDTPSFGTGSNYFIGRPNKITTTTSAYGDVKKSMQILDYINGNVFHKYNNVYTNGSTTALDPITMVETMTYFANGLLKDKEVSATGTTAGLNDVTPRKISYTYDPTNRFVSTVTDPELLISTNMSFHPLYGSVLIAKNPFNQTTTSVFDNWGKQIKVTDNNLNLSTNYAYSKINNIYTTTVTNTTAAGIPDGSSSIVQQDILSREIRKGAKNLSGTWTFVNTEYDNFGRKYRVSEPYFDGNTPSQWTTYAYDDYSRPITVTSFTGKVVITEFIGLTVNVNDSAMSKSKTIDANGQVTTTTDLPGGTITFKYDAGANLIESDYDGIKTLMSYDNWGRKKQLIDTSSGTYNYTYNAYGETKTESNPKGITTYSYDGLSGRVLTKSTQGLVIADATNIVSTFSYNPTSKLLETMTVSNPNDGNSSFAYTYDPQRRLFKTIETQNLLPSGTAIFTKQFSFDTFSRLDVETNTAVAFGKTSTKAIKHSYSTNNGAEIQIKDNTTAASLWQANTVDARGNILTATMGNGINITNSFDLYGYSSQFQHKLGVNDVMKLNTTFDPVLGNLTSRYNSMFDLQENFIYDALDRLTSWEGNTNTLLTLPFNTTTDSFVFVNQPNTSSGSVSNVTGTLKVNLNKGVAQRALTGINISNGNKLRVKATISGLTGSLGVIVNLVMVETNPTNSLITNEVKVGNIENGNLDLFYTSSNIISNPKLTLKFVIDPDSPLQNNASGGGSAPANTIFYVDNLQIDNVSINVQNYDDRGRITDNKAGYYNYATAAKPYQNTSVVAVQNSPTATSTTLVQSISYNSFKAPVNIINNNPNTKISFGYNANEQRSVMYYGSNAVDKLARTKRRYYSADGSMEINATYPTTSTTTPTIIEFVTYIGGTAYTAPLVLKSDGITYNYFYLHRDYQNTILAITNAIGGVVEKRVFDPWGQVTKIQTGAGVAITKMTFFDRGYTGHEHLQDIGLINMNARLYNPTLHRFLEADNYVQDPYNTQNYNRYGYCVNNPLKYTDETGNVFNIATLASCIPVIGSVIASLLLHQNVDFARVFVDAVITGISIGVTFGIGEACSTIGNFYTRVAVSALAHGVFQGGMSAAQGGKFWAGFASGTLSSIAASFWQGGTTTTTYCDGVKGTVDHIGFGAALGMNNAVGTLAFGAIAGGAGSALGGGNFWQGAVTGLIVAGFNELMHGGSKSKTKYSYRSYKTDEYGNVISEKLVYFKNNAKERLLYDQAVSEPLVDNTLSVYGHGNTHNFNFNDSVTDFNTLLMNDSVMYRNFITNGGNLTMNLKSCNTGNYSQGGYRTISEDLTQMRSRLTIHAPAAFWNYNGTIQGNAGYNMFINGAKVGWDLQR